MKGSKQRAGLLSGVNSSIAIILHCGRQAVSTFVYRIFFNWSRSDSAPIKMPASGLFVYTRTLLCAFRILHDATRNQATAMNKTIITNNGVSRPVATKKLFAAPAAPINARGKSGGHKALCETRQS